MSRPSDDIVFIYADESCLGNQFTERDSPGGVGVLFESWRTDRWERRDLWSSEPATTNNRMALRGAAEALDALRKPCRVIFTSDSQYLVKGMREWVEGWVRRGWKRKGGDVENRLLWEQVLRAAKRHRVDWRWVRGHAGHPQNEYANHLATRAAKTLTSSGGPAPSGFEGWLEQQREHDRYIEFIEHAPPAEEGFHPVGNAP
ncbi:MAG: ribonuclease H family protein [Longimicrobiales bacterium]